MRKLALTIALPLLFASATASAHFNLTAPPSSTNNTGGGKGAPPCGPDTTEGTALAVTGGTDLMLTVDETVFHPGFYRVALALSSCHSGDKCFPADNTVYDSAGKVLPITGPGTSDHADFEMPAKFPVLADNLFPHTTGGAKTWMGPVPIPNVTCAKCTLQVIEFMAAHGPNAGGGYFYHHCADLKITADPGKPAFDPNAGAGGAGGGGTGGSGGAAAGGRGGAGGSAAGGVSAGGTTAGGMASGGVTTAGTGSPAAGAPTTAGTTSTAGTGTTTAGSDSGGGPGSGGSSGGDHTRVIVGDDGGCGIAKRTQGGVTALGMLGLLFALVRRRRAIRP